MGLLSLIALAALAAPQESAATADAASAVTVPPAQAAASPGRASEDKPAPAAADPVPPVRIAEEKALAFPAQDPPRIPKPLEDRSEPGPSLGGFFVGSVAVVALLGGALVLLRRFGKNSRLLGNGGPIRILARKPLTPKQEVFLLEVGGRVILVGSTREQLSALGEFRGPDEVAALRAQLPELRSDFRESLREGLQEQEAPREERVFASIADELAEIRKTVRAWRA
jgi:flagellar biogenesis protein FliO